MVQGIIDSIRSLTGDNLGDVFKKFSLYVIANNDVITKNIENLLSSFVPQNNLEKVFKLNLIDKFERRSELIQTFEDEDIFNTTLALKCKWFFNTIELHSPNLVEEVLPRLSYSTRLKLLKRISKSLKDVNKAERIFKEVQQRYGSECAFTILPACSETFVKSALFNSQASQIKPVTIITLFRYFPDLIVDFVGFVLEGKTSGKRFYRDFSFDNCSNVFLKIASKNPERFTEMCVKHNCYFPYMKLGCRATKRLIRTSATDIIKHWDKFKSILQIKHIRRYMSITMIEELQASFFPKTAIEFFQLGWRFDDLFEVTSHLEEDKRQEMLLRNFKKHYGRDLNVDTFKSAIDLYLILSIPVEMRIKWIEAQLPTLEPDNKKAEYISYLPPDLAVPALKEMIVKQNEFTERAHMVKCMLLSASRYKNTKLLVDCISFVNKRLRNDNIKVRENVFSELSDMKELLHNLRIEEWSAIEELIDLVRMNDELMHLKYDIQNILPVKIERYFTEGLPTDEHLKKYFDFQLSLNSYYSFDLCKGTCYEKLCLEFVISSFSTWKFKKEEDKKEAQRRLFCAVCVYNQSHKNDLLELPEWLIVTVEKILIDPDGHCYDKTCLINAISKQPQLKERIYPKIFPHYIEKEIIGYILKRNPLVLKEHKDVLMKELLNSASHKAKEYISFIKTVTLYTPFNLHQSLTDACIRALQREEEEDDDSDVSGYSSKPNAALFLSVLMSPNDFIETITPYKPTKEELASYSDENQLHYRIQKAVASSLKYVNTPSQILSYIKTFAIGDYLKLVVGSINSICLKVAEKKILPLLIDWFDSPVSVRKHFIRAYYRVAPIGDAGNLIVSLLAKEKNPSLRVLFLEHIYKFFLKEPTEETFAVFKAGYSYLSSDDVVVVDKLFNLMSVPDMFVAQFVRMLWDAVELKEGPLVYKNKTKVVHMLEDDIMNLLPEEFCDVLLEFVFSDSSSEFHSFIAVYLVQASDENTQKSRLEKVLHRTKLMIDKDWNSFDLNSDTVFGTRENVFGMIETICRQVTEKEELKIKPTNLLERLKLFVNSSVPAADILNELLRLKITIFMSANDMKADDFVTQLAKFLEEELQKNCSLFGDQIIATVEYLLPYGLEEHKLQLAKILLCDHTSYQAHLMAIRLVNSNINNDLPTYKIIVESLLKSSHPFVKAAAGNFLKNLSSSVKFT